MSVSVFGSFTHAQRRGAEQIPARQALNNHLKPTSAALAAWLNAAVLITSIKDSAKRAGRYVFQELDDTFPLTKKALQRDLSIICPFTIKGITDYSKWIIKKIVHDPTNIVRMPYRVAVHIAKEDIGPQAKVPALICIAVESAQFAVTLEIYGLRTAALFSAGVAAPAALGIAHHYRDQIRQTLPSVSSIRDAIGATFANTFASPAFVVPSYALVQARPTHDLKALRHTSVPARRNARGPIVRRHGMAHPHY